MGTNVTGFPRFARGVLTTLLTPWTKVTSSGEENLPTSGGYLLIQNHISQVDPIVSCWWMAKRGVVVRYLSKSELFSVPVVGSIVRGMRLIPVYRKAADPSAVLATAREVLEAGDVVGIAPEGTLTKDPQGWPMRFKTGAARLALDTRVPVIPLVQWGAQAMLPPKGAGKRPDVRPRRPVSIHIGEPVDLSDLYDRGSGDHEAVEEATRRMHRAVTEAVEMLRGKKAPAGVWDPRTGQREER
ncbi:MAG: lysophospholipid acyltransferase family protein [Actinomycetaceae bacterium]|nr:lysophospholipid acyltransferase family protein [Actinomycetaceae bacterium]